MPGRLQRHLEESPCIAFGDDYITVIQLFVVENHQLYVGLLE